VLFTVKVINLQVEESG